MTDEPKKCVGHPQNDKGSTAIPILCSDSINPKTAHGGDVLGTFTVPHWSEKTNIVIEFHFQGTMFTICCCHGKGSKKRKQELHIVNIVP